MRMSDHDSRQNCRVIPFVKPVVNEETIQTSSIAAVIAVTVLHRDGESPEERLLEIIDASGEAEVLDIADVLDDYQTLGAAAQPLLKPHNDNGVMTLL